MGESRFAHEGHQPGAELVPAAIPGVPTAPACCVTPQWAVIVDGARIRQAREGAGMTQKRLADLAEIGLRTLVRLEGHDRSRCHYRTRELIAAALGAHSKAITAPVRQPGAAAGGEQQSCGKWTCSWVFPAHADQVREARHFLRRMLGDSPVTGELVLICSELAANAVRHSASALPGGTFTVRAEIRDGDYAWIEVEDEGGRWGPQKGGDESGRGLAVVDGIAAYWDIRGDDTGRVVCARLDWPALARTSGDGAGRQGTAVDDSGGMIS